MSETYEGLRSTFPELENFAENTWLSCSLENSVQLVAQLKDVSYRFATNLERNLAFSIAQIIEAISSYPISLRIKTTGDQYIAQVLQDSESLPVDLQKYASQNIVQFAIERKSSTTAIQTNLAIGGTNGNLQSTILSQLNTLCQYPQDMTNFTETLASVVIENYRGQAQLPSFEDMPPLERDTDGFKSAFWNSLLE